MTSKRTQQIYQMKVALKGAKPPIWRRILVPGHLTLDRLHMVIQVAMGWTSSHLHQFEAFGDIFGTADDELAFEFDVYDEASVKLNTLLQREKDSMTYLYDFGDSWAHKVTLEKILPCDKAQTLPACIKGKRACPPEDCGGIWGYAALLNTLNEPSSPDYQNMLEWVGGGFDPEAFDIAETNRALSGLQVGR
jgi:hypothetical protein